MKSRYILILLAATLLLPATSQAQRRKVKKKPVVEVEEPVEDPRITQMLAATQQIVFIDSMVVDFANFMSYIPLSKDCGQIEQTAGHGSARHTCEIGDKYYASVALTDSTSSLVTADWIDNAWTTPTPLKGLGSATATFPYIMPDGQTLYYAQQGEKSIGGYDIFVTRYDAESGSFLKPENIGMPFASEQNDYFFAVDEFRQLGYFVTDRRQPEGKVCIYVFIPNDSHRQYQADAYTDMQIRSLARIDRIADTWTASRDDAMQRLDEARAAAIAPETIENKPASELDNLCHQAEVLEKTLLQVRNYYARASEADRSVLRQEILDGEKELEMLQTEINKKRKELMINSTN